MSGQLAAWIFTQEAGLKISILKSVKLARYLYICSDSENYFKAYMRYSFQSSLFNIPGGWRPDILVRPGHRFNHLNLIPVCTGLLVLILAGCSSTKSPKLQAYKRLSRPEKTWVLTHPFVLKKTFTITGNAVAETEKVLKARLLDQEISGGRVDAFRHAYWMALLGRKIGARKAEKLGIAHEKGNRLDFYKHRLEEGVLPDSISTVMDLFNNKVGLSIGSENKEMHDSILKTIVIKEINKGRMKIIAKNTTGDFVDCQGNPLPANQLSGKWNNNKCLVNSDYLLK